jgi:hypothetical protein
MPDPAPHVATREEEADVAITPAIGRLGLLLGS